MKSCCPTRSSSKWKELKIVVHVATVESAATSAAAVGITVSIGRLIGCKPLRSVAGQCASGDAALVQI
jgi:hypothetical protein